MKFEVNLSKKFKLTSLKNLKLPPLKIYWRICWAGEFVGGNSPNIL